MQFCISARLTLKAPVPRCSRITDLPPGLALPFVSDTHVLLVCEVMPESRSSDTDVQVLILGAILEFALIVIAILVGSFFQADVRSWIIPTWKNTLVGIAATLPMYLLFLVLWRWNPPSMRNDRQMLIDTLGGPLSRAGILGAFLLAALAGIGEGLFFRGTMQTFGGWAIGVWPSIVITNVVFGLMHKVSWSYAFFAFAAGMYFSLLDQAGILFPELSETGESGRNLLAPMISHGLYDFLAFLHVASAWRSREENS